MQLASCDSTIELAAAAAAQQIARNVLGGDLGLCCLAPRTGFMRDGFCRTNAQDQGRHLVCALVTDKFLQFTKSRGNDLMTPAPHYDFPGLRDGDKVPRRVIFMHLF